MSSIQPSPGLEQASRPPDKALVGAILAMLFLAATDTTIIGTLLPQIADSLGRPSLFPWLMSGFMVAMALVGPLTGALADRHGARAVLSWAIVVFLAGSGGAALAPGMPALVAARALQGAGAGMIIVLAYASLAIIYGPARRGKVQSMVSIVWGVAAIVGPLAGLALGKAFGWRAAFLINVPVGLACLLVLGATSLGRTAPRGVRIDAVAQGAFAACVLGVMVALSAPQLGLSRGAVLGMLALSGGALALLLARARGRPESSPVPPAFWRDRALRVATLVLMCGSVGLYASITLVPSALHARHAVDGAQTGVIVVLAALGFVLSSAVCGMRIATLGYRRCVLAGTLALAAGALILAQDGAALPWQATGLAELCIGLGMGGVAVGVLVLAQNKAPAEALAGYTATVQLLRNIGAALGINALAALQFASRAGAAADSLHAVFALLWPVFAGCALLALLLPGEYRLAAPRAAPSESRKT